MLVFSVDDIEAILNTFIYDGIVGIIFVTASAGAGDNVDRI